MEHLKWLQMKACQIDQKYIQVCFELDLWYYSKKYVREWPM